jgi:hypothetical protein
MRFEILGKWWGKQFIRLPLVLLIFGAAVAVEYYVSRIPAVVDISAKKELNPALIELGQKKLVLEHPSAGASGRLLVSHDGTSDEVVDARFDKARLSAETMQMLAIREAEAPPAEAVKIELLTEPEQQASKEVPCKTAIAIEEASEDTPVGTLGFYQLEAPDVDSRHVEIESSDSELVVQIETTVPRGSQPTAHGCVKMLRIGDWSRDVYAPFPLKVITSAGAAFRLRFAPTTSGSPPWMAANGLLGLDLGTPLTPDNPIPFGVRAMRIDSLNPRHNQASLIGARALDGDAPLVVSRLEIGPDQLQIQVSGKGRFTTDGQAEAMDLIGVAGRYPLVAALVTTANGALLAWLVRVATAKRKAPRKPRRSSKRGRSQRREAI